MKKIVWILAVAVLVVALGIFAYGYFFLHKGTSKPPKPTLQQLKAWQFALPQTTTNTAGGGVVQLTVVFQAGNNAVFQKLKLAQEQLESAVVSTCLTIPGATLKTPQGEQTLEKALLEKSEALLQSKQILAVEIPQLVVQS
jgi:flagellar basal body-associated protein FliL